MSTSSDNPTNPLLEWPLEHLMSLYQLNQVVFTLIRLGVPEHLAQHPPQTLQQLAEHFSLDARLFEHVLQIACAMDLLQQNEQGAYTLTDKGQRLRADATDSLLPDLSFADDGYQPWGVLQRSLQTNQSAFSLVHGMHYYAYARQHPDKNNHFNRYMTQTTAQWLADAPAHYPFAGHLVDMGGNHGAFTARVLQQYPELNATLFDLEQALTEADAVLDQAGVRDRCRIVPGDFFDPATIPSHGDIYLFSRVLFNWSDAEVVQILQHCRQAMPRQAKLVILEFILPDDPGFSGWLGSLSLWVMFGSRSRTRADYEALLTQAGFTATHWWPGPDKEMNLMYLEACPV